MAGIQNPAYRPPWLHGLTQGNSKTREGPHDPTVDPRYKSPDSWLEDAEKSMSPDDGDMVSPFAAYCREIARRDYARSTCEKYEQILRVYEEWLAGGAPSVETAGDFSDHLRKLGLARGSLEIYYHVVRGFHESLGQNFRLKFKKRRSLPPYYPWADVERLLAQASAGLSRQTEDVKARNYAVAATLAFTGMRRSEVIKLRVRDVDFGQPVVLVRDG